MDSNFQSLALFEIIFSNDSAFDLVLIIWTVVLIILEQWTVTGQWTSCLALTDHLSASAAPFKSKQWTMQMQKYFVGKNCDLDTEPWGVSCQGCCGGERVWHSNCNVIVRLHRNNLTKIKWTWTTSTSEGSNSSRCFVIDLYCAWSRC